MQPERDASGERRAGRSREGRSSGGDDLLSSGQSVWLDDMVVLLAEGLPRECRLAEGLPIKRVNSETPHAPLRLAR